MGVPYYGDFAEDDTVKIPFNTFTSDDPSISCTVTQLLDSDIRVYKDGGATPIATDGATVVINLNSQTGAHIITVDTNAHSDYSTGSEYAVLVTGVDVDGGELNSFVGAFSIERAGGALAILKTLTIANGAVNANPTYLMGTILAESGAGQLAAAFNKLFDVVTPVLTAASVDQGADNNTILSSINIANGAVESDLTYIHGTALTETAGQLAGSFTKFFNVATPTGTVDSIPDAVAGAAGGLAIVGSEMVVPDNQKVDLNTVKTQAVTCAAAVTFNPSIGAATIVPTNVQFEARTIAAANYLVEGDTLARVTLVDTVTDNTDLVTAAVIKTAMEASGSDLDNLMIALVNKLLVDEDDADTTLHDDAGDPIGIITDAFTSAAGVTSKKRMVYVPLEKI